MTDKNPYRMPFLMTASDFASKAAKAILAGSSYRVIPWQMAWIAKLLRLLPNAFFDKLFGNRPYKPRRGQ